MQFLLDPDVLHLNHGSFGAVPQQVHQSRLQLLEEMEARPMAMFGDRFVDRLEAALASTTPLLGTPAKDLVFCRNTTQAMAAVLASQELGPGDEILTTDHRYDAVANALDHVARTSGATLRITKVPFPIESPDQITQAVVDAITDRTRLLVIDHIASSTALVFPIKEIAQAARLRGVRVAVDGAHVPGQLPVNVPDLGVDYWMGNLHKWGFTPRGTAVLWVRPGLQDQTQPPIRSLFTDQGFKPAFHWVGTDDPTPWLCAPVAMKLAADQFEGRRQNNHRLVQQGREVIAEMVGTPLPHPDDAQLYEAMATIPLPGEPGSHLPLREALMAQNIDAMPLTWRGQLWIRISGQVYNHAQDYETLGLALRDLIRG